MSLSQPPRAPVTCRPGLAGRVRVRACRAHFPNPRSQLRGEQHPHPPPAGTDVRHSGSDSEPRGPHAGLWDPEKVPLGRAALGSGQGLWGPWGRNSVQVERWAEGLGQRGEPRGESVSGSGSGKWRGACNAVTPGHALPGHGAARPARFSLGGTGRPSVLSGCRRRMRGRPPGSRISGFSEDLCRPAPSPGGRGTATR